MGQVIQDWRYIESTRKPRERKVCALAGCDKMQQDRLRFCARHYRAWRKTGDPMGAVGESWNGVPIATRLEAHTNRAGGFPDFTDPLVRVTAADGECWTWTGALSAKGYGHVAGVGAHRAALMQASGIDAGLYVDHLCRRPECVNPGHLEAVTHGENISRGRSWQREKTHCPQRHEYTPENTYIQPANGGRKCRTCQSARRRK